MPRQLITLPSFSGVGAGATATLSVPTGDRVYHEIRLVYGTDTASGANQTNVETEVSEIRLKVNGRTQRVASAKELIAINAFHGKPFNTDATGVGALLPMFLSPPWARSAQGEDALGWGMSDVDSFTIEVDIANNSSQTPTLSAVAVVENTKRAMGPISKWRRYQETVSATGIKTNVQLPREDDIAALYAFESSDGDIDGVTVKVDQQEVFAAPSAEELQFLLEDHGKTDVSALFPVLFNFTNRVSDTLKVRDAKGRRIAELRVDWDMGAANSFSFIAELYGLRD